MGEVIALLLPSLSLFSLPLLQGQDQLGRRRAPGSGGPGAGSREVLTGLFLDDNAEIQVLENAGYKMLNDILDAQVRDGRTVILTTHDLDQGLRTANRAIVMDRGKIVFSAAAQDPAVREAYAQFIVSGSRR